MQVIEFMLCINNYFQPFPAVKGHADEILGNAID